MENSSKSPIFVDKLNTFGLAMYIVPLIYLYPYVKISLFVKFITEAKDFCVFFDCSYKFFLRNFTMVITRIIKFIIHRI